MFSIVFFNLELRCVVFWEGGELFFLLYLWWCNRVRFWWIGVVLFYFLV